MTKKEQAIEDLRVGLSDILTWNSFATSQSLQRVQDLVHAIDAADREERGVVDVDEIKTCFDCRFYHDEGICCTHENQSERGLYGEDHELPGPPSWCPRRKENQK